MTNGEWKKIEIEFEDPSISQERWLELMAMTEKEDECPEWWNSPCICKTCMSYADIQ